MQRARSSRFRYLLVLLGLVLILALTRSLWLPPIGSALIHDEGPAKADIAVVLAGDQWGNRILKAGELAQQGFVPFVLVSGPPYYGIHECDLAISYAVSRGYLAQRFIALPNSALSTKEEAQVILTELKRRNVRSFLLVTSDYHTARSRRIYREAEREMGGGPHMRVVAAPDQFFRPDSWWRSREGLKTVFMEWSKTISTAIGN